MVERDTFWEKHDKNYLSSLDELNDTALSSEALFKKLVNKILTKSIDDHKILKYFEIIDIATKINNNFSIGNKRINWIKSIYDDYKWSHTLYYYNQLALAC